MDFRPINKKELKSLLNESNEDNINRNQIYLSFYGFTHSHELISNKLGLTPNSLEKVGDKIIRNEKLIRVVEENRWKYEWIEKSDLFISDFTEKFFREIIETREPEIIELSKKSKVQITIVQYFSTSNNPGYYFSAKSIKIMSNIDAELQMDIYCLHEE
jgi:hypothetical protein